MSSDNKRPADEDADSGSDSKKKCKRRWGSKSRWGNTDGIEKESVLSGLPTVIPMGLTKEQEEQYLLQLQIEEITRRLQTGELGIAPIGERSPSPEPVYNHEGKRTNTREVRTRKKLENDRHKLIQKVMAINPHYKPPHDYRPPVVRYSERVFIPQDEHPEIGFIGMIIGPRGNSLRKIEKETGANIVIRGKGSVKEGRIGTKDGKPLPGADEPLHAYITGDSEETMKRGVDRIRKIISDAINIPDEDNDWMREQLRELAVINGTLRDSDTVSKLRDLRESEAIVTNKILCHMCGGAGHIARDCKQRRPGEKLLEMASQQQQQQHTSGGGERGKKLDVEYMSLMAELGQGPAPPSHLLGTSSSGARPQIHQQRSSVLALPAPSSSQSAPTPLLPPVNSAGSIRPLLGSSMTSGVRPLMPLNDPSGFGTSCINGQMPFGGGGGFSGNTAAKPSLSDLTAGALLLASVVQGLNPQQGQNSMQTQGFQANSSHPNVTSTMPSLLGNVMPRPPSLSSFQNSNMFCGMQQSNPQGHGGGMMMQQTNNFQNASAMPNTFVNQPPPPPPPWISQQHMLPWQQQPPNATQQQTAGFQSQYGGTGFMGGGGATGPNQP
jgi:splicing factor 1